MSDYHFIAGTKLADFISSNRALDVIQGPLGSGKTYALCIRIMRHIQEQVRSPVDGIRHSRFAIVRNTMPDLRRTTIVTWLRCFPEDVYGRFIYGAVMQHRLRFGDIDSTVDFMSLDKAEDVRKLRSGEWTGIAFNELGFQDRQDIFIEARSRLRYPEPEHGGPTPWSGVIADTNAPDEDHWLAAMTGQVEMPVGLTQDEMAKYKWPPSWGFHMQPPALIEERDERGNISGYKVNPAAENLANLPKHYYQEQLIGAPSKAWIDSRLMNRVALVVEGSPVWPMFTVETHVAREPLVPVPGHEVIIGVDFGRTAGAVFMQAIGNRVFIQHELLWQNQSTTESAPRVKTFMAKYYPNFSYRGYGDPKGNDKGQHDDKTGYEVYAANGINLIPAPGLKQNMISTRIDAVASILNQMEGGKPRFIMSPVCRTLKVAMAGRYHNKKDEAGELKPSKDKYSHIADALQYACIGLGEGRRMVGLTPIGDLKPVRMMPVRRTMRRVTA